MNSTVPKRLGWSVSTDQTVTDEQRDAANELIAYHSPITHALTAERTSYSSQMIPVTPYILVAVCESFTRYADMMRLIDAAMPAEQIGAAGRRPGSQINSVYLWSISNFFLTGRKALMAFDPSFDRPADTAFVLDFWDRAARGFRGDGHRQAEDAGRVIHVYDDAVIERLASATVDVDDDLRITLKRWNATLVNYLFLLYFDTRVGTGDTGPYDMGNGRSLLVRDYYRMGVSDFWWSDVARELPYQHLVAGFVLDGVDISITDFGSSRTNPESYMDHLVGFSLFTTDDCHPGEFRAVSLDELAPMMKAARTAEAKHYRAIAAMDRDEMIRCGAYVYFSFLRPFAEVAGVADQLDWTVPRDLAEPVYELLVQLGAELGDQPVSDDPPELYYHPIA